MECGSTFQRHVERYSAGEERAPLLNIPLEPATWDAIEQLARTILDPVADKFGEVEVTYGFAGPELVRAIRRLARAERRGPRIAPSLDQHAGHELLQGERVCPRPGAAVDFRVPGASSERIAGWLLEHAPVDRLYLYGDDRPLHVSWAPSPSGAAWRMQPSRSGRWLPAPWRAARRIPR